MKRVNKLFVGYDIAGGATSFNVYGVADDLAEGEVVILNKNKLLLTAGDDISDSDIIYVALGGKTTFTDVNGTSRREAIISNPIEGAKVRTFNGESYSAATNKIVTCANTGLTPVVGDEYVLRIAYKDMQNETPAQYIQEWRVIAGTTSLNDLYTDFATIATADPNARVTVVNAGGTLTITGITIPFSLNQIDSFKMVDFDVRFNHVTPTGPEVAGPTVAVSVDSYKGIGDWREVRDLEKESRSNFGITNFFYFPVPTGVTDWFVNNGGSSSTKTYDFVVIEHDASYLSPDLSYNKEARLVTTIALPVNCVQGTLLLAQLNPWMASTPRAFANVSI